MAVRGQVAMANSGKRPLTLQFLERHRRDVRPSDEQDAHDLAVRLLSLLPILPQLCLNSVPISYST